MFISYCVCLKCRGRVVTNVVRTCDPTPLLYIFGNKICLNYLPCLAVYFNDNLITSCCKLSPLYLFS